MGKNDDRAHGDGLAAFHVQNQIRRNAQDMQEYLAELGSWEESIKKKDKQLSRKAAASTATASKPNGAPPIRRSDSLVSVKYSPTAEDVEDDKFRSGSRSGKIIHHPGRITQVSEEREGDTSNEANSASAASHTYDRGYGKWEKFDVESALQCIDDEVKGPSDSGKSNGFNEHRTKERSPQHKKATRAHGVARRSSPLTPTGLRRNTPGVVDPEREERERGNAFFSRGDFEGAVRSYTRCVGMNSKNAVAFSNRAMAYIKLKEFSKAEADCDAALQLDSRHVKSLQRRAVSRNALGKHRAALCDLQTAAEIDPSSKEIGKEIAKTTETLKAVARRAPKQRIRVGSEPLPAPEPRSSANKGGQHVPIQPIQPAANTKQLSEPVTNIANESIATVSKGNPALPCDLESPSKQNSGERSCSRRYSETRRSGVSNEGIETVRENVSSQPSPSEVSPRDTMVQTNRSEVISVTSPPRSQGQGHVADAPLRKETASTRPTPPPEVTGANSAVTAASMATGRTFEDKQRACTSTGGADSSEEAKMSEVKGEQVTDSRTLNTDSISPESMHPRDGTSIASSKGTTSPELSTIKLPHTSRPRMNKHPIAFAASANKSSASSQLPATGYQLEHMWRSASTSDEKVKLLQTIPPTSISKMFRRTPLELELLEGILQHLRGAFLPGQPMTALRWLKSLSKASRFGMAVSLMGEGEGRGAVRDLLDQLKIHDVEAVEDMRRQYLC